MGISITQVLLILIVVLILFGAGKLPQVMGELGKGVKNFRDSMKGEKEVLKKDKKESKSVTSKAKKVKAAKSVVTKKNKKV